MERQTVKKIFLISFVLLFLSKITFPDSEETLNIIIRSPDKSCTLRYKGRQEGQASYYRVENNTEKEIYKGNFRYGPIVNWISNSFAELRIPSGSPNYNSYFYDCLGKKLSPNYSLPLSADPVQKIVATMDMEEIIFWDLYKETVLYRKPVPNLEPMTFLIFCKPDAHFKQDGTFILKYHCPKNPAKVISVKKKYFKAKNILSK